MRGLSLVVVSRGYSLAAVLGLLIALTSLVVEHGLQDTQTSVVVVPDLVAPLHVESSGPGIEPVSPSLAHRFLTTGQSGKSPVKHS